MFVSFMEHRDLTDPFSAPQVVSLFLLASYYSFAQGLPYLAVVALLLYVGCYQVTLSIPWTRCVCLTSWDKRISFLIW